MNFIVGKILTVFKMTQITDNIRSQKIAMDKVQHDQG